MADQPVNPWIEGLQIMGLSVVLALGIRQFVAEARYIPSRSMEPTLKVNDRLVIEKIGYHFADPDRGDIIVFWPPEELLGDSQKRDAYIKRVVGLPGETVEITDGVVLIDGEPLAEDYIKAPPSYQWGPAEVDANTYPVLGDNRNHSYDSHEWGFLPEENIIGRAIVRFWPISRLGGLD